MIKIVNSANLDIILKIKNVKNVKSKIVSIVKIKIFVNIVNKDIFLTKKKKNV